MSLVPFLGAAETDANAIPENDVSAFRIQLAPDENAAPPLFALSDGAGQHPGDFKGAPGMKVSPAYSFSTFRSAQPQPPRDKVSRPNWWWVGSQAALSAANLLDVTSSLGKHELNPVLAGSGGRFDLSSVARKDAMIGGLEAALLYGIARNPSRRRFATIISYTMAVALVGVAAHNYTVPGGTR
ncbi:MAG: hypothetical protein ABSF98_22255 [Bryobacteraceae bacterium]